MKITESFSSQISHCGVYFSPALVARKYIVPCKIVDCSPGKNFRFDVTLMAHESEHLD